MEGKTFSLNIQKVYYQRKFGEVKTWLRATLSRYQTTEKQSDEGARRGPSLKYAKCKCNSDTRLQLFTCLISVNLRSSPTHGLNVTLTGAIEILSSMQAGLAGSIKQFVHTKSSVSRTVVWMQEGVVCSVLISCVVKVLARKQLQDGILHFYILKTNIYIFLTFSWLINTFILCCATSLHIDTQLLLKGEVTADLSLNIFFFI